MADTPEGSRGTYTTTGWRIVGKGAERLAERLTSAVRDRADGGLAAGRIQDTLYALQCTFEPVARGRPTVERVLDAVTGQIRQVDSEAPRLVRDEEVDEPPSRFGGLRFRQSGEGGRAWTGELVWRAVHPVVAGAPVTTHLILEEKPGFTRLSVRVTADEGLQSVRGYVGAGQAYPPFLRSLRADLTPTWLGGPLRAHPIRKLGVKDFVHSILAARDRAFPVAVLAPLEDGSFVVEPDELVWDLLGRARLHVLTEHRQTFDLSDTVGDRRMSCYLGALRCYLPGWSRHDDPFQHPLLVGERLADPVLRTTWFGEVGLWMGRRVDFPPSIREPSAPVHADEPDPEVSENTAESPAAAAAIAVEAELGEGAAAAPATGDRSSDAERFEEAHAASVDLQPFLEALLDEVRGLSGAVEGLADEVERLRTISSVRSSSTNAIERRLGRLEDILEQVFPAEAGAAPDERPHDDAAPPPEEGPDDGRPTLLQVVRDSAESYSDALVFLDSCYASAEDSPYEDPERVRAILEAMARVARRRRDGVLGTSLRESFRDLGIDYRAAIARSTPSRLREQYRFAGPNGELVEAEEHIVLGNTYDPRRCLRIYFSSRVPDEPSFVIGHVGRHFEVMTST